MGSIRHIQAYARTYLDAAGKPLRSLGVSWDVTEEVLTPSGSSAGRELRDAQRRLERASLPSRKATGKSTCSRGKHWASSNYYALLGYGPGEIELDTFDKLDAIIHPDDLRRVHEAMDRHIADASHAARRRAARRCEERRLPLVPPARQRGARRGRAAGAHVRLDSRTSRSRSSPKTR